MSAEEKVPSESARASEIAEWLAQIGLGRYAAAFAENAITLTVVPELTDADLREPGVLLGDRKLILREIVNMRDARQKTAAAPSPVPASAPEPASAPNTTPIPAPAPPPESGKLQVGPPSTPPAIRPVQQSVRPKPETPEIDPKSLPSSLRGVERGVEKIPAQAPSQKTPPRKAPPKPLPVAASDKAHSPSTAISGLARLHPEEEYRQRTPEKAKSRFDRLLRAILASRFLTVSALIHLLILLLFGGTVLVNKYIEPPDFQSTGDSMISTNPDPAPPQPAPEASLPPEPSAAAPATAPPPYSGLSALTSLNTTASSFSMPVPDMAPPTVGENLTSAAPSQTQAIGNGSAVALPGAMAARGAGREGIGRSYGETGPAEESVLRALRWLQTQQKTDGTWGSPPYHDAFTGLALLCYLGHGETPQGSHEFGVVMTNAINALVTEGNNNEGRFSSRPDFAGGPAVYQHGICTYALCEAYTMTKDERLAPIVAQAVDYIVKGQRPDGGWAYGYDLHPDVPPNVASDTSISGWQIQALKAAHLTGIPGMDKVVHPLLNKAMKNLDRVFNPKDGSYGYNVAGDRNYSLTGVGALSKLFWLGRTDNSVNKALKNIMSKDLDYNGPDCNLYAWYYNTQACFQAQGGAWDWWNARFQDQLTNNQSADGSWPPPPKASVTIGGFGPAPTGDGPLLRTTLCCLMLEVFYRYLPTSQEDALGGGSVEGL